MKRQSWGILVLAGGLAGLTAACQSKTSETAANPTPAPTEALPTAVPVQPTPVAASPVTADPVAASQRNAEKRRQYKTSTEAPAKGAPPSAEEKREAAARARVHEVPSGSILRVAFDKTISTATAKTGATVGGELLDDLLAADGTVVAPSGSRVLGRIEQAAASGRLGGQAELSFRLSELTPTGGRPVPISTSAYRRKGETHTTRDAEYIAGGAAVGALLGQVLGRDGQSTLLGAAAGAAAGAATGQLDFEIQAGRTVAFTLEEPLHVATR